MEDIKAVDIINYVGEAGLGKMIDFGWEEFRRTKKAGFMSSRNSPEELVKGMDEAGYEYVVITNVKKWSYKSHLQLISDYGIEVVNDIVQKGKGRLIGGASYNSFRIAGSLRDIEKAVKKYGFKYVYFHPHYLRPGPER